MRTDVPILGTASGPSPIRVFGWTLRAGAALCFIGHGAFGVITKEGWVPYFARRYPRRLMAEALLDSTVKATGVPISITVQGLGIVTKAMALPDPTEASRRPEGLFLNEFGRGNRDDVSRTNDSSIAQALSMMNDTIVTTRVRQATPGSTVGKILASTTDPGSIADQIYLATLSRAPSPAERQQAIDFLRAGTLSQRAEDLQWTLLNSLEFLFY